jgi:hypothetical protein
MDTIITTWFQTIYKVSRTYFIVVRSLQYLASMTLYISSSTRVNVVVDDLAGLMSTTIGFSNLLGIIGLVPSSGLTYF